MLTSFLEKSERPCLVDSESVGSRSCEDVVILIESGVDDADRAGGLNRMTNMHGVAKGANLLYIPDVVWIRFSRDDSLSQESE